MFRVVNLTNIKQAIRLIWEHPSNRPHRFLAVFRSILWEIYKRVLRRHWDLRVFGGLRLRCYTDSTVARGMIYYATCPDYHEMHFLKQYLREGDCFVDVGANIGSYTLLAASLIGFQGHIDAFEPGPKSNPRLSENVKLNHLESVVSIHNVAVGNISGPAMYRCAQDATNRLRAPRDKDEAMEVMCVRLDDVLKDSYALGKIDIEGAEPLAFQGAEDHLRNSTPPVWIVEMNAKLRDFGFSEEEFAAWLNDRGWDLAQYDSDYRVLSVGGKPWLSGGMNVFAISRSAHNLLKERIQNLSIKTLVQ